jgi:hypothetical protein
MSLGGNAKVLLSATHELARQWDETKSSWRDTKAHDFEQEYLVELFACVERTVLVFEQMDKLIAQARRECE